jgi:transcriptional regulator of arginine metabolism
MANKQQRQTKIRELLQQERLATHEKLAAALRLQKIQVSQATLSKDLRELGVVRVPSADGGFRYTMPESGTTMRDRRILERELADYLISAERAQNLVVIKTSAGHAQSLCAAIDQMEWEEIMGTIGGDDTILVITPTAKAGDAVLFRLSQ